MGIFHLAQNGFGNGNSWESAASIADLQAALRGARSGDEVIVGFERDREDPVFWNDTRIELTSGGVEGDPLRISFGFKGDDRTVVAPSRGAAWPFFRAIGRASESQLAPDNGDGPFLEIEGPVSYLLISGPVFAGSGNKGFFRFSGPARELAISHVHALHAGRVIECQDDSQISDLIVQNCSAFGLTRGFARFEVLSNATFRDLHLDAAMTDGTGNSVLQIIKVDSGTNLRFERILMANAVNAIAAEERGSSYIQGDGLVLEEGTSNVQIHDCSAVNMGDGGFDLKTDGVQLTGCSATGCKYGVRIWRQNRANHIDRSQITAPQHRERNASACLWVGGYVRVTHSLLSATGGSVIRFGDGYDQGLNVVEMRGGAIELHPGSSLLGGEPGQLVLRDVLLDGKKFTGTARWDGSELFLN